ncbi:TonB-dependent receptor [Bacteroidia bacterium]|nr:TonB-dependent receptor [Bacteroidia bacterium]
MKKTVFIFALLGLIFVLRSQTLPLDSAVNNLSTQVSIFPQEKIYLQTDKPYYISGEKVFFRIFLLDAFSHRPADWSRYVYVELINERDSVKLRQQIRPDDKGLHYGTLSLPEDLAQGNYQIRAYTRFMENAGEDYFFTRTIYVADPTIRHSALDAESPKSRRGLSQVDSRKLELRDKPAMTVDFYPEGGNLIAGQLCNVAFKALTSDGQSIAVNGEILDAQNNPVTEFATTHEGMGRFTFRPEAGEKYVAVCRKDGQTIRVNLPEVKTNTYALSAVWRQNKLWITVNKPETLPAQKLYFLAHTGGMVLYSGVWNWSKGLMAIDKADFPSGVSHLLLLTEDYQPVSERLVFALNNDWITPDIQADKQVYKPREKVKLEIDCHCGLDPQFELARIDLAQSPDSIVAGNFSISVTDDKDIQPDTTLNILSRMLLTSELKGYIFNPAYYFQKDNRQAEANADLLMLTHGWNRYDIPKAMRGDFKYLTVPNEVSQSFSGIVKGGLLSKPYKGATVKILSLPNFYNMVETEENGRFTIKDFEFPDSTRYSFQALSKKGKDIVELYLDSIVYPPVSLHQTIFYNSNEQEKQAIITQPEFQEYVEKADLKYINENGMRTKNLPELVVKAKRAHQSKFVLEPDNSMSEIEIRRSAAGDIRSLVNRIPDVKMTFNSIRFRVHGTAGYNLFPPMIIVDGMPLSYGTGGNEEGGDWEALNILNLLDINEVVQVDFIRSPAKLAGYGSRGKYGVIEIYTKKSYWDKPKFNLAQMMPLGYQTPIEFYSPQYDTPEARENALVDLRSTIYWKPDVLFNFEGKATVEFYTADTQTTYSVIIEGVTTEGKLIYCKKTDYVSVK